MDVEIGIVGAGPAGARAAELLAGMGADVVLWDPRAPWEKPCGGGLAASAFRACPELGELRRRANRIGRVLADNGRGDALEFTLDEALFVIPRQELGRWQLDRARRAGAEHIPLTVRGVERTSAGWEVVTSDGGVTRARLVVGADGAGSLVRKTLAPGFRIDLAPTRVAYVPGPGPNPDAILLRFMNGVVGYLWDFPRPDHRSVGIGIWAEGWSKRDFDLQIQRHRNAVDRNPQADVPWKGAVIGTAARPHPHSYATVGGPSHALLGDAAGFADPAFGEGIRNALRSAALLAEAYSKDRSFRSYPARARDRLEPEFRRYRRVRRHILTRDRPDSLIQAALRNHGVVALLQALVDWENGQEANLQLPRRWLENMGALMGTDAPG